MMRNCPRCERLLFPLTLGGVTVDGCDGCGGVWFDHRELTTVAQAQTARLKELEDTFQAHVLLTERKVQISCPTCRVGLVEFEFKHSPGIKLDGCPQCRGIWVDDGELRAIHHRITGATASAASTTHPPFQPDVRQKAQQAMGFLTNVECPGCKQPNPTASKVCWACGAILEGKRGFICPRCDKPLSSGVYDGLRLDTCKACGGMWVDAPEFPVLMQRSPEQLKQLEQQLGQTKVHLDAVLESRRALMCPLCYEPMIERSYTYGSGIRLNTCGTCRGVWADAGELSQIAEFIAKDQDYFKVVQ
ncbi:MAG: zf-TFIIB domain-containing protein [Abditibacteriales bacterium]|nr:zf-TFIIB domain-containing protein [Abditibacteriales bacterium]MDW8365410.1 zf-TFIIB domain-containing protein [Abditibacteriales bacterium]